MAAKSYVPVCIFLMVFLTTVPISDSVRPRLVLWNVGQGQWLTVLKAEECLHFDTGGEFAPWSEIEKLCHGRRNRIYISHWDRDHYNFLRGLSSRMNVCLQSSAPAEKRAARFAQSSIPKCSGLPRGVSTWSPLQAKTSNDSSRVSVFESKVLITGDSSTAQEKYWRERLALEDVKYLVLGHHGSVTSTAPATIMKLPKLKMALCSARQARYGHPHHEVLWRLHEFRIPILRTEDWGNIIVEL